MATHALPLAAGANGAEPVRSRTLPRQTTATLTTLTAPWKLTFPPNLGAPQSIDLPKLQRSQGDC